MRAKGLSHRYAVAWVAASVCLAALLLFPRMALAVPAKDPGSLDPLIKPTCHSHVFDLLTPSDLPSDGPTGLSAAGENGVVVQNDSTTQSYLPLLIIAVGFDGQPYDTAHDWNEHIFVGERSVSQFYTDMSCGKFTFLPARETSVYGEAGNTNQADKPNDGVVHVSLDRQKTKGWAIYDDEEADREMLAAFSEALAQADHYVDFASYDSNGDGLIQTSELALCFVVAGVDAASYSAEYDDLSRFIWPHAWYLSSNGISESPSMPVVDGVTLDDYIAIAEYSDAGNGTMVQEDIGTLTHELAHYLGLPDLYDITYDAFGVWSDYSTSYLSLMDLGVYGIDLAGNNVPFSLDMWSRVTLGWVEPATLDEETEFPAHIAGSLATTTTPLAYRIDTKNPDEYYLLENRRFTNWDEGMGKFYRSARASGADGEDLGGGLVLWHIDNGIVQENMATNTVNTPNHHPGVMPAYVETDDENNRCMVGASVNTRLSFFDANGWGRDVPLPMYGTMADDKPEDRTLSVDLVLSLDSGSSPVMDFHLHKMYPFVSWADDYSSALLWGLCRLDLNRVELATTTDIASEVIKRPSTTEMGEVSHTAYFKRYDYQITTHQMTPSLDEEAVTARDAALAALADLILGANAALAQGAYTPESFDALRNAIVEANVLYEDDTTTEQDVAAAREELLCRWRLLEPKNLAVLDPAEQEEREAHAKAIYNLAEQLCEVCDEINPQDYKPEAYSAFAKVVDRAYDVMANDGSTTQELVDAKVDVERALAQLMKDGKRIKITAATVRGLKKLTYNGKARKPKPQVTLGGKKLAVGKDYKLTYANNKAAGKATVTVVGTGDYTGKVRATFTIAKAANTLSAKGKAAKLGYAKVRKATKRLAVSKVVRFANKGKGRLTYAKVRGNAKISVNKKTGKVSVSKGLKKGTYRVKLKIKAAGNANYASATKTVTFTLRVS